MATAEAPSARLPTWGAGWHASYLAEAGLDDVLRSDAGRGARWWQTLFEGVAVLTEGNLARLHDRINRQVIEVGTAFRLPGEQEERRLRVSPLPLLIGADEWRRIAEGIGQRAELLEAIIGDVYGEGALVSGGALPAALVAGSSHFLRSMIGTRPNKAPRLQIYAADLARGPDGEWRVLADLTRGPAGAGYALENRLAASRVMGSLQTRLNVERLAPFFSAFRDGLAATCERSDPRLALLTPGRYNQSYAEQAHLARYLGFLLVEGADLAVRDRRLYVRTIDGLKRIDALWSRMDARWLDPLAFDSASRIGTPGLMDAVLAGSAIIANAPGVGIVDSRAMAAFLPMLARRLTGEPLKLPNIATWWCGQERERAHVLDRLDDLLVAPAFDQAMGLPGGAPRLGASLDAAERAALIAHLERRPQDYVGQEVVQLSTMPTVVGGRLTPRPFMLRVFAARDADGAWTVMPGGFARLGGGTDARAALIGEGTSSADVAVLGLEAREPVSLLPVNVPIRRNPGTLPSRAADNLFWLGRYLERGEGTLRLVRAALGGTMVDAGALLNPITLDRIASLLISTGAAELDDEDAEEGGTLHDVPELARAALDGDGESSVRTLLGIVRAIGEGTRDRLSVDVWRQLDRTLSRLDGLDPSAVLDRATVLQGRFSALAGLSAENMARTAAWRFHDLGRRVERGIIACRLLRHFARDDASVDDLSILLDLADSQISYRARYLTGLALVPARDLVALDPYNPRSLAFQVERMHEHLTVLPRLRDDGMAEEQQTLAVELSAAIATAHAESLGPAAVLAFENRLQALSDAIGRRFFLQDNETLRSSGLTLA